jgi:hypothetical protein
VQDLGLGAGLCLNQLIFFLFISHKLVSELGLGTSKLNEFPMFFLDFNQGSARLRPGYRVMLESIFFSLCSSLTNL